MNLDGKQRFPLGVRATLTEEWLGGATSGPGLRGLGGFP